MRASTKRLQPTKDTCGVLLYDQDEINKSWESYLSDLHKPKCKPQYDNEHQHIVDNTMLHLPNTYFSNNDLPKIFSVEDVENKCKQLTRRNDYGGNIVPRLLVHRRSSWKCHFWNVVRWRQQHQTAI